MTIGIFSPSLWRRAAPPPPPNEKHIHLGDGQARRQEPEADESAVGERGCHDEALAVLLAAQKSDEDVDAAVAGWCGEPGEQPTRKTRPASLRAGGRCRRAARTRAKSRRICDGVSIAPLSFPMTSTAGREPPLLVCPDCPKFDSAASLRVPHHRPSKESGQAGTAHNRISNSRASVSGYRVRFCD